MMEKADDVRVVIIISFAHCNPKCIGRFRLFGETFFGKRERNMYKQKIQKQNKHIQLIYVTMSV